MLKVLRDNLRYLSWVLWGVIVVFILFVFVDFGATVPGGSAPNDAAVTVGGQKISFSQYENAYRQTEDFYRQIYGEQYNSELAEQMQLSAQVLERLIAEEVMLSEARDLGLRATDGEVQQRILELDVFRDELGRYVGAEEYRRILRANRLTPASFEEGVRREILLDKLRGILAQSIYVSAAEVERTYREQTETAAIRFVRLASDDFEAEATEAELAEHYESHRDDYQLPEQRVVDYLLVDTQQVRAGLEIAEEDLEAYYQANLDSFREEEQVRARHILLQVSDERPDEEARRAAEAIRGRIEGGEDFAAVARAESDDRGSAEQGGDLGFFGRGRMIAEFEEAAFAAQPGDLVGPIKTSFGYHLIEVQEKKPAGTRDFEEVRAQIESRLAGERARTETEAIARQLAERVAGEGLASSEGLRQLAQETDGAVFLTTEPFGRADAVPGIGRSPAFASAAFELPSGGTSEALQVPRGWAVLHVADILEPRIPELAEVEDQVREAVESAKRLVAAREKLAGARARLEEGADWERVAGDLDAEIGESGDFRRNAVITGLGRQPEVNRLAFDLEEGKIGGPVEVDGGVVLFEVTGRQHFDPSAFESAEAATRERLANERLGQILASLIERRRSEMKVEYNPTLIESLGLGDAAA